MWLIRKNVHARLLLSIIIIIVFGVIIGFFASGHYSKIQLQLSINHDVKTKQFITAFTQNYWYFFLLWGSAFIPLGFTLSYLIIFFKGFIFGVTFNLLIKAEALFGVYSFFKLVLWQVIILFPLFLYLSYHVLLISFRTMPGNKSLNHQLNINTYLTLLLIITLGIALYSLLVAFSSIQMIST